MTRDNLTPKEVRRLIDYDPDTGALTWRSRPRCDFHRDLDWSRWNTRFAGRPAFTVNSGGYLVGRLAGKMRKAHRVAWAHFYGAWPEATIDHVNRDKRDNRIHNLRDVSRSVNLRNMPKPKDNTSGVVGVYWRKDLCKWRALIAVDGKTLQLGHFEQFDDAVAARKTAEREHHFHPSHGLS